MLNWSELPKIYLFKGRVDMRCGFDRLAELAKSETGRNPLGGDLFVFLCRRRRRVKMLVWDRDGYFLLYKRLEVGTFRVELRDGVEELSGVDLKQLLEGVALSRIKFRRDVENGMYR